MKKTLWPKAIIFSLLAFMAATSVAVYLSFSHKVDLVQPDYYKADLSYDNQKAAHERLVQLPTRPQYRLLKTGQLEIKLPPELLGKQATAALHLYNPADSDLDRHLTLSPLKSLNLVEIGGALTSQRWRLKVMFTVHKTQYYEELPLNAPH